MKPEQHDKLLHSADWLAERDLPVAIILTEELESSGGPEAIIFPPTYARRKGDHPYAITTIRSDISAQEATAANIVANICDLDSFGAQANRMEPVFKRAPLSSLVPQLFISAKSKAGGDAIRISLLDAGHRVADGAVRFAAKFGDQAAAAIGALARQTNADLLARLAPTSLVFGFWDSRATQYKFPRIISSSIRANNVAALKRSAQFNPSFDPTTIGLTAEDAIPEPTDDADQKDPLSKEGLRAAPAVDTHGGVRVFGSIVRRTEINLVALRALAVTADGKVNEKESLNLRRYLFGLALVAGRCQSAHNLRQGCLLVLKKNSEPKMETIFPSGKREAFAWDFKEAFEFATAAAKTFGVFAEIPAAQEFDFQPAKVAELLKEKAAKKPAKKGKKGTIAEANATPPTDEVATPAL